MEVDSDLAVADCGEAFKDDLYQRLAQDREQRLGQVGRDRPQPFAEAGGRKKNGKGIFWHAILPYKIFENADLCRRAQMKNGKNLP